MTWTCSGFRYESGQVVEAGELIREVAASMPALTELAMARGPRDPSGCGRSRLRQALRGSSAPATCATTRSRK